MSLIGNEGTDKSYTFFKIEIHALFAKVAELVDALDLGSSGVTRESSSLSFRMNFFKTFEILV